MLLIELTIVDVFPVPDDLTAAFAGAEMRVNVHGTPPAPVKRDASAAHVLTVSLFYSSMGHSPKKLLNQCAHVRVQVFMMYNAIPKFRQHVPPNIFQFFAF